METLLNSKLFVTVFWSVASISSILYSVFALKIHLVNPVKNNMPWLIHQRWFNFIGAFIGWIILWIVIPNLVHSFVIQSTDSVTFKDIILLLMALIGITGYLPLTIYGIAISFKAIADKMNKS